MIGGPSAITAESFPELLDLSLFASHRPLDTLIALLEDVPRIRSLTVISEWDGGDGEYEMKLHGKLSRLLALPHLTRIVVAGNLESLFDLTSNLRHIPSLQYVVLNPTFWTYDGEIIEFLLQSISSCKALQGLAIYGSAAVEILGTAAMRGQEGCLNRVRHFVSDRTMCEETFSIVYPLLWAVSSLP